MASAFDRKYELVFGTPAVSVKTYFPAVSDELAGSGYEDYNTEPGDARIITDLQLEASITKSGIGNGSKDSSVVIKVYNMTKETEAVLYQEGAYIHLRAGYATDLELPTIFAGQVKQVRTVTQGSDRVTHITCGSGYIPKKNLRVSETFPNTVSKADIIRQLVVKYTGLSTGYLAIRDLEDKYYNSGRTFSGRLSAIMDTITRENGLKWFIDDNKVYVYPKVFINPGDSDFFFLTKKALQLNSENMLSLKKEKDSASSFSGSKETKSGINIKILLDGRVSQGDYVVVEDEDLGGTYEVQTVKHIISYRGTQYFTDISAKKTDL